MHYLVTLTGHVDQNKRPKDFPEKIHQVFMEEVENPKELVERIAGYTQAIIVMHGMLVRDDPYAPQDSRKLTTDRKWVPMHMLTHLSVSVIEARGGVMPQFDKDGNMVNKSEITVN
jgi:hypothetical protein